MIQDFTKLASSVELLSTYILNDFSTNYMIQLKLLSFMYILELVDIFSNKSLNTPTSNFNITDYVMFSSSTTRSSLGGS